jgi:hypothetical protein
MIENPDKLKHISDVEGFSLYFQILLADKRVVLTQQCLNFLHVRFREIGVFLRGNGSRNTGGFTRAATRGHNTE